MILSVTQQIILIIVAAINLFFAVRVLLDRPRKNVNRAFFVFACGLSFWLLGLVFVFVTKNPIFDKFIFASATTLLLGFVLQLEGLWRSNRRTTDTLDTLDQRLSELHDATSLLNTMHSSASPNLRAMHTTRK